MSAEQTQVYDKCNQVVAFHNHLVQFFQRLIQSFPDLKKPIRQSITFYRQSSRNEYIISLHKRLEPHISRISEYDEGIFSDDYCSGSLELLPHIDFKKLWQIIEGDDFYPDDGTENPNVEGFRQDTKTKIFNSLQGVYLCAEIALGQINHFDKALQKQKEFLMNMIGNLKLDEKLKERVEQLTQEEAEANKGSMDPLASLEKLGEIFGEDNFIYKLAKEVADEINIGNDIDSPVDTLTALFADDGKKLQELIISVEQKLQEKVQKGEVSQEQLFADAEKMRSKFQETVGHIPGFSDMLNPKEMLDGLRAKYDSCDKNTRKRFKNIPQILQKEFLSWTAGEKKMFDQFTKYLAETEKPEQSEQPTTVA